MKKPESINTINIMFENVVWQFELAAWPIYINSHGRL